MKNVLIVDYNITSLKQIGVILEGKYNFSMAKSGRQALSICASQRPDIILLDVEMPEMSGFETITRISSTPTLADIPVIFLTGSRSISSEVRGFKLGARDFIKKPAVKSVLLHRLKLHLNISAYHAQLAESVRVLSDSLSTAISDLIECRDENTGGHVIRTSKYFDLLGRDLIERGAFPGQLTGEDLEMMVRAAPLHDIGKISISDSILLKPDLLTEDEFRVMKTHTEIGATILSQMHERAPTQHYLKYAILIAASHHERYDGAGYPANVAGERIPLCGRIMAVADVYDAVANDRVYRKSLSHPEACNIISSGKGIHFDPYVVDSFKNIHHKFLELSKTWNMAA